MNVPMRAATGLICLSALLLAGCAGIGPPTVVRDRFEYVAAISDSWKRQTLLNLLKVRYADAPVFMDVTSVISGYSVATGVTVGGQVARPGRGDTFANVEANGQYADRPTISYQPLFGDKFARSVMTPIPVAGILSLIQAGYPADVVLRICVNSINGLENDFGGAGNPRAGSPKFRELMTALRQSQATGGAGFRTKATKEKQSVVLFFRPSPGEEGLLTRHIRELLGLDPTEREFTVVYGSFPEPDAEIAILTRSMLQIMIDLASQIDVPAADIAEGRVYSPQRTAEQERMFPPLVTVRNGASPPEGAYVAVRYRDQWYWIDDRDQQSKRTLTFLMMAFSLTEGVPTQSAPVVTIPAR
jgi:hypothetical protein